MFKNIAVLIDADNIGSQYIDEIFSKIKELGTIATARIYGDFAKPQLSPWKDSILKHAIEKKHQTSYTTGKNSSDIALVIDAMDLLHSRHCDAFCIVSSDSDFISLALRLRQNKIQVFGFGGTRAIKEFRQACSQFFEISIDSQKSDILPNQTNTVPSQKTNTVPIVTKYTANQLKSDTTLISALRNSIQQCLKNGWAYYSLVNSYLLTHYNHLSPNQYGYKKWINLIQEIDFFKVETKILKNIPLIREKSNDHPVQTIETDNIINTNC